MNDSSSTRSEKKVLTLTVPVPDGLMTEETYTVSLTLSQVYSPSNVRTSGLWTYLVGSPNSPESVRQTVVDSVQWSIRSEELSTPPINTPLSHSGCWCGCSEPLVIGEVPPCS